MLFYKYFLFLILFVTLDEESGNWNNNEKIPESDSTPHINVGSQFQCTVPPCRPVPNRISREPSYEDLLWDPGINNCTDTESKYLKKKLTLHFSYKLFVPVDMYLDFACCAAVPGGGRNKEYAMHLLHLCGGNIHVRSSLFIYSLFDFFFLSLKEAMLRLMQPSPNLPSDHPLLCYTYSESDKWSISETEEFHKALLQHDKDFNRIAQEVSIPTYYN